MLCALSITTTTSRQIAPATKAHFHFAALKRRLTGSAARHTYSELPRAASSARRRRDASCPPTDTTSVRCPLLATRRPQFGCAAPSWRCVFLTNHISSNRSETPADACGRSAKLLPEVVRSVDTERSAAGAFVATTTWILRPSWVSSRSEY